MIPFRRVARAHAAFVAVVLGARVRRTGRKSGAAHARARRRQRGQQHCQGQGHTQNRLPTDIPSPAASHSTEPATKPAVHFCPHRAPMNGLFSPLHPATNSFKRASCPSLCSPLPALLTAAGASASCVALGFAPAASPPLKLSLAGDPYESTKPVGGAAIGRTTYCFSVDATGGGGVAGTCSAPGSLLSSVTVATSEPAAPDAARAWLPAACVACRFCSPCPTPEPAAPRAPMPVPAGPNCRATQAAFTSLTRLVTWTFNGKRAAARLDKYSGNLMITLPGRGITSGSLCVTVANGTAAGQSITPAACPTLQALCGGGACSTSMKLSAGKAICCSEGSVSLTGSSPPTGPPPDGALAGGVGKGVLVRGRRTCTMCATFLESNKPGGSR